jgi:hypothetical protein
MLKFAIAFLAALAASATALAGDGEYRFVDVERVIIPPIDKDTAGQKYEIVVGLQMNDRGQAWFYEPASLYATNGWKQAAFFEVDLSRLSAEQIEDLKAACPRHLPCVAAWHITLERHVQGAGFMPPDGKRGYTAFELAHEIVRLDGWDRP